MTLWLGLLARPKRQHDFRAAIGTSPADWFLATQGASAMDPKALASAAVRSPSKGTLAHFESVFADDTSLRRLRA